MRTLNKCPECKELFKGKKKQVHCSRECRGAFVSRNSRAEVNCSNCETVFLKRKTQIARSKDHYCSADCKATHYRHKFKGENNPHWKGLTSNIKCLSCNTLFEYRDYYGSANKYCSQECKGEHQKIILLGVDNPNYKHGKSDEDRLLERSYTGYKEWRMEVFKRDDFNCLKCETNSTRDNKLVAHHILNHYSHPALRIEVSNGATLCTKCHWDFHRLYGTMHNNQQQIDEFLTPKDL